MARTQGGLGTEATTRTIEFVSKGCMKEAELIAVDLSIAAVFELGV